MASLYHSRKENSIPSDFYFGTNKGTFLYVRHALQPPGVDPYCQVQLAVAQTWGEGKTSSSDGQRFRFRRQILQRTYSYRLNDYALEFYSFVADNYAPFYSTVIECTDRDAAYVLDGLLYNESDLALQEHYTDTHGYTEINFAAFAMLGRRFAPRIRGLQIPGQPGAWPHLQDGIHLAVYVRSSYKTAGKARLAQGRGDPCLGQTSCLWQAGNDHSAGSRGTAQYQQLPNTHHGLHHLLASHGN